MEEFKRGFHLGIGGKTLKKKKRVCNSNLQFVSALGHKIHLRSHNEFLLKKFFLQKRTVEKQ